MIKHNLLDIILYGKKRMVLKWNFYVIEFYVSLLFNIDLYKFLFFSLKTNYKIIIVYLPIIKK